MSCMTHPPYPSYDFTALGLLVGSSGQQSLDHLAVALFLGQNESRVVPLHGEINVESLINVTSYLMHTPPP